MDELRSATSDLRYSESSRSKLARRIEGIASAHASGAFPYASDWGVVVEEAFALLVDVSALRQEFDQRLAETELADLTDSETKISYYRVLSLAQEALSDADAKQSHVDTLAGMLRRES